MQRKMFPNIFRSNSTDVSKCRVVKNLIVISLSFFFINCADIALIMLQTTMNKKDGVGTISVAFNFITCGIASLTCISFLVKKLGVRNAQILGLIMMLPYIVSNVYPTWITMLPAALLRGIGLPLFVTAQNTHFNESSVLFGKIKMNKKRIKFESNITPNLKRSDPDEKTTTVKSDEQKVEQISAFDLLSKTGNSNSDNYHVDAVPIRLGHENEGLPGHKLFSNEESTETTEKNIDHNLKIFNDKEFSEAPMNISPERKKEIILDSILENTNKERYEAEKRQSYVNSTKSIFFGVYGLSINSASVFSNLISYYVLKTGDEGNYKNATLISCGAGFCNPREESFNNSIAEVPDDTRYLLTGVCIALGLIAPLLLYLFLDCIFETKKDVKLSWDLVLSTIKYVKKKDQLLLVPFTINATLCKGFYLSDFTKSYIACSWNLSHIGLISAVYGASSAFSSIASGFIIKYVGRISVMSLCHIVLISHYIFLFFWNPDPQQPYMFYVQATIMGMMSSAIFAQSKAIYGVLFEGDEETAFSSCTLYSSLGWALPFAYNNFFCTSVKIYIALAFSCTGLLGYLLAERSYNKRKGSS